MAFKKTFFSLKNNFYALNLKKDQNICINQKKELFLWQKNDSFY